MRTVVSITSKTHKISRHNKSYRQPTLSHKSRVRYLDGASPPQPEYDIDCDGRLSQITTNNGKRVILCIQWKAGHREGKCKERVAYCYRLMLMMIIISLQKTQAFLNNTQMNGLESAQSTDVLPFKYFVILSRPFHHSFIHSLLFSAFLFMSDLSFLHLGSLRL